MREPDAKHTQLAARDQPNIFPVTAARTKTIPIGQQETPTAKPQQKAA